MPGTLWYWGPVGGIAAVKDAWQPFEALLKVMSAHSWMFPAGWVLAVLIHWLTIGVELDGQRQGLDRVRKAAVRPKRRRR
ncbi:hypothetical protein [uncultured Sphingomonas sp.]|uniref:hypothetical protein n=1 Tax=uncultured Sphingomonas sp. TaxID=158754 RepID=UPI0035CC8159